MPDEIVTLLGDRRPPPSLPDETRDRLESQLADAAAEILTQPADPDAAIWLGRRTAYLGNFHKAVELFSEGIARWPKDARFLRHRGHRWITLRRFDAAIEDLEQAVQLIAGTPDQTEPDGQPNSRGIPTSTLHFNIWYHLGLARYLRGDFERALAAYWACYAVSANPDALVATSYWLTITLRRLGRDDEAARVLAPITEQLDVIENGAYHRLLLLFRGLITPDDLLEAPENSNATLHDSTVGYGIGAWHRAGGRSDEAAAWFRRIYAGPQWAAFGFIAAEADLARPATDERRTALDV